MRLNFRLLVLLGGTGIGAAGCHGGQTLVSQGGRCGPTPTLLVSTASYWPGDAGGGIPSVVGMAADGADLYFTVGVDNTTPPTPIPPGALMHVSAGGGAVTELSSGYQFQAPLVTPTSVIVGVIEPSAYQGGVLSVPRNGGAPTPLVTFEDELIGPPVTDGASVYFVDNHGVQSVPAVAGTSPASPATLTGQQPLGLAVVGQRLLLLVQTAIREISLGSGDAGAETGFAIGTDLVVPRSLIPCGADGCWLTGAAVRQIDPASGLVSTLGSLSAGAGPAPYLSMAFDGTDFFVLGGASPTGSTTASIERFSRQGGAPVTVATLTPSYSTSNGFAAAGGCVYVATTTGIYSLSGSAEGVSVP